MISRIFRAITTFGHEWSVEADTVPEALEKAKARIPCEGEEIKYLAEQIITYKFVWRNDDQAQ